MLSIFVFLCSALAILEKHVEEKVHFFNFLDCLHYTLWEVDAYYFLYRRTEMNHQKFDLRKTSESCQRVPRVIKVI